MRKGIHTTLGILIGSSEQWMTMKILPFASLNGFITIVVNLDYT